MDEYSRLTTLNAIVKGWAEYYKYTSLLVDIEEITRHTWFRYLAWLLKKHKGSRKAQSDCCQDQCHSQQNALDSQHT